MSGSDIGERALKGLVFLAEVATRCHGAATYVAQGRARPRRTRAPYSRAHAVFFRRRHQPRRPPPAKRRPGRPAPAIGPGTGTFSDINAVPFAESFFGLPAKCDVAHTSLLIGRSTLLFVDWTANAVVRRSSETAPLTRGFFAPHGYSYPSPRAGTRA